jgi:hypothetical protein
MNDQASLLGDVLTDIADGPAMTSHTQLTEALMRRFAEKGLPLSQLVNRKMMDRSPATLKARARQFNLQFSDYVPMALRRKVELIQMGDFYECIGEAAEPVAKALGIVLTKRGDKAMCGLPVHAWEDYKAKLAVGFIVKIVKAKKPRKVKAEKRAPTGPKIIRAAA